MASDDKYDRQVRLWGAHGQRTLCNSHVVLLGTSSAGSETLKNLVLPAIGAFTIVCDRLVRESDFGNDFFVTRKDIGRPKAQVVCEMLSEMNPDVKGNFIVSSVDSFICGATLLQECQLVICTDPTNTQALQLSNVVGNTPLCLIRQYGMLGYLRVFKRELTIIESKDKENPFKRDLRMAQPWPELKQFAYSFDFDALSDVDHTHVPYAVILIQAADQWRAQNQGQLPSTFKQKDEFKAMVRKMNKYNGENFDEAINTAYDLWQIEIPEALQDILNDDKANTSTDPFWLYVAALREFVRVYNRLPVSGTVPDMISTTNFYLQLQQIYVQKSKEDQKLLKEILLKVIRERVNDPFTVDGDHFNLFCRNLKQLVVQRMRSVQEEFQSMNLQDLCNEYWDKGNCCSWLIVMKAFETLRDQGVILGEDITKQDQETLLMRQQCDMITERMNDTPVEEKYIREILRFGLRKLHNISAYLGGAAAQECVKMLIQQYTPIQNTLVYDGIHGRGQMFNL